MSVYFIVLPLGTREESGCVFFTSSIRYLHTLTGFQASSTPGWVVPALSASPHHWDAPTLPCLHGPSRTHSSMSMSLLLWGTQCWTQPLRCVSPVWAGRQELLLSPGDTPGDPRPSLSLVTLLPHGQLSVHQDAQDLPCRAAFQPSSTILSWFRAHSSPGTALCICQPISPACQGPSEGQHNHLAHHQSSQFCVDHEMSVPSRPSGFQLLEHPHFFSSRGDILMWLQLKEAFDKPFLRCCSPWSSYGLISVPTFHHPRSSELWGTGLTEKEHREKGKGKGCISREGIWRVPLIKLLVNKDKHLHKMKRSSVKLALNPASKISPERKRLIDKTLGKERPLIARTGSCSLCTAGIGGRKSWIKGTRDDRNHHPWTERTKRPGGELIVTKGLSACLATRCFDEA